MATDTDVVVVGGGVTGCGVARDLSMRGLDVTLLERDSLNAGTSGRSHGLLHSGARYADVDPVGARDCHEENRILRGIAGACVEETGGYVVSLEGDDGAYFEEKLDACHDCGIDATVVDGDILRRREPSLTGAAEGAIEVPDAVVYPSRLIAATAASAVENGAAIETGATVTDVDCSEDGVAIRVVRPDGGTETIEATHAVNAAGPWAGEVASLASVELSMAPTRGVMVALDHAGIGSVLNRSRPPDDGDIVVPHPDAAVCGTTSVPVGDPDHLDGRAEEVESVRDACAEMVPSLADATVARTFWGVRPLHEGGGREATRGFAVLDHERRDGAPGLTTVVGGKLTTHRLMAEAVADLVSDRLDASEPCRTAGEPLVGHDDPERLDELVESFAAAGPADEDVVADLP